MPLNKPNQTKLNSLDRLDPEIRPLSGSTAPCQSEPGGNGNEGVRRIFPKVPALLKPHHQVVSDISKTFVGWDLTPL